MQPFPPPNPIPFDPESLRTELAALRTSRMIEIICNLHGRLRRVEELIGIREFRAISSDDPTASEREIVADLGNGLLIVRTAVLEPSQTAQDGHSAPQPTQPVRFDAPR